MGDFLKECISFSGRWNRKKFWLYPLGFSLMLLVINIILFIFFKSATGGVSLLIGLLLIIMYILVFYVSICAYIKRFHDLGKSGWFTLLIMIPFVNIYAFILAGFVKGNVGTNVYGYDPLESNRNSVQTPEVQSQSSQTNPEKETSSMEL